MPRLLVAVVVAMTACALVVPTASAALQGVADVEQRFAGIPQNGRTLGRTNAPLTLTYFHDLKCPFCKEFSTEVLPRAIRRYVRSGKLKIVAQPVAFVGIDSGADSRRAAAAALAFGYQRKYWNFMDLFYLNQQDETTTYVTDPYLNEFAVAIPGVDQAKLSSDRKSKRVSTALTKSWKRFERMELVGVPTLTIVRSGRKSTERVISHVEPEFSRALRQAVNRLRR